MENKLVTYTLNELAEFNIDLPAIDRSLWYTSEELSEALGRVLTANILIKYANDGKLGKFLNLGRRTYFLRADLSEIRSRIDDIFKEMRG